MTKPVSPKIHGVIDYVFSGIQMVVPSVLGINTTAVKTYTALGGGFLAINALTDTPAGIKRKISFKDHQKADAGFLAALSLLTYSKIVRQDRKALGFHLGFLAVAIAHYVFTDYDARPSQDI